MIVVSDTSSVSALLRIGQGNLLQLLYGEVLIPELNGRRVAVREGVPIIGLMGVLIKAKNEGLVASIRPLIEKLETEADFRLSVEFKQSTLRRAHEL